MNYILFSLGVMVLFILGMCGITVILYRRITDVVPGGASMVDLERLEGMEGQDEIGQLIKSFRSMEYALKKQMQNVAVMTAEKEKVRTELSVATRIQADMIPKNFSVIQERMCDIFGNMRPAKEVGGDFYDFFPLDDEHLCAVIGDVSGKGVPAALFMTKSKIYLKQRAMQGGTPAQILLDVNNELCTDNQEMLFVTVWLGILHTKTGALAYCNAGHEFPILFREGESRFLKEERNDPPLALAEGITFHDRDVQMQKGEKLFIYTDGMPEAKNESGDRYTIKRMLRKLEGCAGKISCEDVAHIMGREMAFWMDDKAPFDDVTMLIIGLK